ncbi:MAG: QueT transporter family protein [Clostridiales bacterium]|nr:QueT transporter family protein [Clostridiales bacterium]
MDDLKRMLLKHMMNTQKITRIGVTAALYASLTLVLWPISFGMIQLRVSEMLCLLAFIDPVYAIGVTLGCFIANIASPLGIVYITVGTLHTAISVFFISRSKSLLIASLWPTVFSVIIGAMISIMTGAGFFITTLYVMASEFIVVTLAGVPVFSYVIKSGRLAKVLNP